MSRTTWRNVSYNVAKCFAQWAKCLMQRGEMFRATWRNVSRNVAKCLAQRGEMSRKTPSIITPKDRPGFAIAAVEHLLAIFAAVEPSTWPLGMPVDLRCAPKIEHIK